MNKDYIDAANDWFDANLNEWLAKYPNKWAVVFKNQLLGIFDSYSEAYRMGVSTAKSEEILVRQIREKDDKPTEISINITLGLMNAGPAIAGSS